MLVFSAALPLSALHLRAATVSRFGMLYHVSE